MSFTLFVNASQVVTCSGPGRGRRGREMADADVRANVGVAVDGKSIAAVGDEDPVRRALCDAPETPLRGQEPQERAPELEGLRHDTGR